MARAQTPSKTLGGSEPRQMFHWTLMPLHSKPFGSALGSLGFCFFIGAHCFALVCSEEEIWERKCANDCHLLLVISITAMGKSVKLLPVAAM